MSKSVWKYEIIPSDVIRIEMPVDAKVLFVAVQYDRPCLWAEVDVDAPIETREFRVYGTGHRLPDDPGRYLGTFIMNQGTLVFHVYE